MPENTHKLHIMPAGDEWEVEDDEGAPLTPHESKEAAIADAQHLAQATPTEILLHHPDGVTEPLPDKS